MIISDSNSFDHTHIPFHIRGQSQISLRGILNLHFHRIWQAHLYKAYAFIVGIVMTVSSIMLALPSVIDQTYAAQPLTIVNMGDSYASGLKLVPVIDLDCGRSGNNYAHLAAQQLQARLIDVSCSGATTQDFSHTQVYTEGTRHNPPQFDALQHPVDVILVSIGGNDADLISDIESCAAATVSSGGCPAIAARSTQKLRTANANTHNLYRHIRQLEPHALIIGVGYGKAVTAGTCLAAPFTPQVSGWISHTFDSLSAMTKSSVESIGGTYIDSQELSYGHDICSAQPWYVGVLPVGFGNGEIGHPRAAWMQAIANAIVSTIDHKHN